MREQWLEERRKGIGGSDSSSVLGVNPYKSARKLALEKLDMLHDDPDSGPMMRGRTLEPIVADLFTQETGIELVPVEMMRHPDHPFMLANMDRITKDGITVAEIKCPGIREFGKAKREGLPQHWIIQLQHYMTFPGKKKGIYIVFNAERWEMLWFEQYPDLELQNLIVEHDKQFWQSLQAGVIPEEDNPIIDLPPAQANELITIDTPEWWLAIQELREAREIRMEAEDIEAQAKEAVKQMMGFFPVAEGAGARIYNKWQDGRTTVDTARLKKEMPETYEMYAKKGKPSQPFRFYDLGGKA